MKSENEEIHFERGLFFFREGRPEEAIREFGLFLESGKKKNDLEEMAISLNALGRAHASTGKWSESIEFFKRSLNIYETIGDERGCAILHHDLGRIHFNLGRIREAEEHTHKAIDFYDRAGDIHGVISALGQLAQAMRSKKDLDTALSVAKRGLDYSRRVAYRHEEVNFLADISNILRETGRYKEALEYSMESLKLSQKSGNTRQEMVVLGQMGQLYRLLGEYKTSLECSRKGLSLARRLSDTNETAIFLQDIAKTCLEQGEYPLAEAGFLESLGFFTKSDNHAGVTYNLKYLAEAKFKEGDPTACASYCLDALRSAEYTDFSLLNQTLMDFFPMMAQLIENGNFPEVTEASREARHIIEKLDENLLNADYKLAFVNAMRTLELFTSVGGDLDTTAGRKALKLAAEVDKSINLGLVHYINNVI